jgi:hypothetical protein
MNKFISILIVAVLILSILITAGCSCGKPAIPGFQPPASPSIQSKGGNPSSTSATSQSPSNSSKPAASSSSSGSQPGDLWSDIPIYAGATQVQKVSSQQPGGNKDSLKTIEWRFFETTDDVAKVSSFYQSQMAAKGWTKTAWLDMGPLSQGTFQKNNANLECLIQVMGQEGKTSINIMSGSK